MIIFNENLQASLAALNSSLIHLQQSVLDKDQEINELKERIKEKNRLREDQTFSLVGLLINLYSSLLPRKVA